MPKQTQLKYLIEVRYRPLVPENVKYWRVFHDYEEINKFMELTGEFSTSLINRDEDTKVSDNASCLNNSIGNHDIIELKSNFIPKGLMAFERLFSNNDTLLKPTRLSFEENVISCNIGTTVELKLVKLSKAL